MIRFLFRLIGLLSLAAAFILVVYDGTKSIAINTLFLTSARDLWTLISPASLAKLQPLLAPYAGGLLWDPLMLTLLAAPASALLGVVGILCLLIGRRKKPLIGYERA